MNKPSDVRPRRVCLHPVVEASKREQQEIDDRWRAILAEAAKHIPPCRCGMSPCQCHRLAT